MNALYEYMYWVERDPRYFVEILSHCIHEGIGYLIASSVLNNTGIFLGYGMARCHMPRLRMEPS